MRRVAAAKVGLHHSCDDARSDDRAHNSVALRKERGGTTRLLPAYTEFGIPADVQVFVLLGGYAPAVSGWNFGRRGGSDVFGTFPFYLSDYRDIPMSLDTASEQMHS